VKARVHCDISLRMEDDDPHLRVLGAKSLSLSLIWLEWGPRFNKAREYLHCDYLFIYLFNVT
jgi:hypothetical protein